MLVVEHLESYYGAVQALRDVSLRLDAGEAVAVLGPNGAGKSTLLKTISGLVRARSGSVQFEGHELTSRPPHAIVRLGVVQVPEGRHIFGQMTVLENLRLGAYTQEGGQARREHLQFAFDMFPVLAEKKQQLGKELSGGQQQMLAIARALMGRPTLLLLDEPSLGLAPIMVEQVADAIGQIRKDLGTSILLVEQNAGLALEMASRLYVMQTGRIVLSGAADSLALDDIRQAYLGNVPAA